MWYGRLCRLLPTTWYRAASFAAISALPGATRRTFDRWAPRVYSPDAPELAGSGMTLASEMYEHMQRLRDKAVDFAAQGFPQIKKHVSQIVTLDSKMLQAQIRGGQAAIMPGNTRIYGMVRQGMPKTYYMGTLSPPIGNTGG
eukprot:gnl/Chilomastix_cuspidata/3704.p4 GENE.gnl/Chilomastix_cuspidata/3704~~gnl/Chilomastix_cuspidata/3704.p4  ORF type:complete len:142 (-),score=7.25 gnl/Chilomastix_cuspidata/3704:207-632(-)